MEPKVFTRSRLLSVLCGLLMFLEAPGVLFGEPSPAAVSAFNAYSRGVESRLGLQHRSPEAFLALAADSSVEVRLRRGDLIVEQLTPAAGESVPGGLLHHWRGTMFAPGATARDFERLMRDFKSYPEHFAPEVVQAQVLAQHGDNFQASMRVRQHHVITVVMDTEYDVTFGRLDVHHGYSISRTTRVAEIDSPGTSAEHVLASKDDHGFLWRLNTYWSYEEHDGGLTMQIESVSLTRSIPRGLGWVAGPFVESIPRESLEFTLRSAGKALGRPDVAIARNNH